MSQCYGSVNGHAGTFQGHFGAVVSDKPSTLAEAQNVEQTERMRLLAAAHRVKRERLEEGVVFARHAQHRPAELRESMAFQDFDFGRLWADYFDLGKPDQWQFFGGGLMYRRHGGNPPFFRTEQELDWLRSASRWVVVRSPHATGFIGGVCAYVINKGMTPKATPADGTNDPADAALCKLVQRELDEFCERVEFNALQQEIFYDALIDGEYFLHLFDMGDHVEIRQVLPELVRQPAGASVDEWAFGIQTPPDDPWQRQALHVTDYTGAPGFISPWSDVVHFPLRLPGRYNRGIKRAMPLFAFGAKDAFEHAEKLLRAMGIGVTIRQGFAYFRQWAGVPREAATDFSPDPDVQVTNSYTGQTRDYRFAEPGAVIDSGEGMNFAALPHSPETSMAIEVADAMLRRGGAVFNVPSWLVSTSGRDQGAYSADLAHEAPFVKRGEQLQQDFGDGFLKVMRRVRDVAVRCGKLPPEAATRVKLTMEHPTLEARNKGEEATRDQVYVGMGVKSKQQVAQEQNLDYEKQRAEIKQAAQDDAAFQREQQAATMGGASVAAGNRPPGGSDTSDAPPAPILPGAEAGGDKAGEDLNPFGDVQESRAPAKPRRKVQRIHRDPLTGDMIGIETIESDADLMEAGEPRTPPRPGLVFDETSHRWVRPEEVKQSAPAASDAPKGEALSKVATKMASSPKAALQSLFSAYSRWDKSSGADLESRIRSLTTVEPAKLVAAHRQLIKETATAEGQLAYQREAPPTASSFRADAIANAEREHKDAVAKLLAVEAALEQMGFRYDADSERWVNS